MLGPLVAAENQRFLYIMTRGTELDLRKRLRVRYYLSGRQGDELNNGAMAQLVARFHGMEEVGGSNPPSSTKNSDTQLVSVGFLLSLDGSFVCCAGTRWPFMARVVHPLVGHPLLIGQGLAHKNNVLVSTYGMFKICQTYKTLQIGAFACNELLKKP